MRLTTLVLCLLLACMAFGQAAPDLPNQTFGLFARYDAFNAPHTTGGFEVTKLLTTSPYETIGVTNVSFQPLAKPRGAVQTTVTLGLEQVVLHGAKFHVLAIGGAGVATSGTTTAATFEAGGGLMLDAPKLIKNYCDFIKFKAGMEHSALTAGTIGNYTITFSKRFGQ